MITAVIDLSDLTTGLVGVGTALVGVVAVVAGAAFGVKAIPMGARFCGRVWKAIAG
jgi:hypothetical protein